MRFFFIIAEVLWGEEAFPLIAWTPTVISFVTSMHAAFSRFGIKESLLFRATAFRKCRAAYAGRVVCKAFFADTFSNRLFEVALNDR